MIMRKILMYAMLTVVVAGAMSGDVFGMENENTVLSNEDKITLQRKGIRVNDYPVKVFMARDFKTITDLLKFLENKNLKDVFLKRLETNSNIIGGGGVSLEITAKELSLEGIDKLPALTHLFLAFSPGESTTTLHGDIAKLSNLKEISFCDARGIDHVILPAALREKVESEKLEIIKGGVHAVKYDDMLDEREKLFIKEASKLSGEQLKKWVKENAERLGEKFQHAIADESELTDDKIEIAILRLQVEQL